MPKRRSGGRIVCQALSPSGWRRSCCSRLRGSRRGRSGSIPPLTVAQAAGHIRSWLAQPNVELILPGDGHTERVLDLLQQTGTAGNLVTDAQLAALAIEQQAILHTADADFLRFPGVRWFNPITGIGSDKLRRR